MRELTHVMQVNSHMDISVFSVENEQNLLDKEQNSLANLNGEPNLVPIVEKFGI